MDTSVRSTSWSWRTDAQVNRANEKTIGLTPPHLLNFGIISVAVTLRHLQLDRSRGGRPTVTPPVAPSQPAGAETIARVRELWLSRRQASTTAEYKVTGTVPLTVEDASFDEYIGVVSPHIPYLVAAQHAMLGRMVRYLVKQGITQFLDLGSGIPTHGHVHDVAQAENPECRVVYVDNQESIVEIGRERLAGNDHVAYLCSDLCNPTDVLNAADTRRLLDFERPIAVLLIETLLHIPDSDNPSTNVDAIISSYIDALAPGSYLGISHFSQTRDITAGYAMADKLFGAKPPMVYLRGPDRIETFFTELALEPPGIVPVQLWHPDPEDVPDHNPHLGGVYVGLGRKH
ncbi:SAM-dependent methyltransferase [Amycolatopsis pigmentata]|uniref:SAM-dependent methyltransferase n=1 Tax=Amycolatopsis pigmentata TaxID=450801 RepID=A0ABW5G3Y2_9PSEU